MKLLGSDSTTSNATDNRIAATDQAKIVRGNKNTTTEAGGKTKIVSGKGKNLEVGSTDLSGAKVDTNTGLQLSGVAGNVTVGDGGAGAADIAKTFAATLNQMNANNTALLGTAFTAQNQLAQQNSQALSAAVGSQTGLVSSAIGQVGSLAASQQTGGVSDILKPLGWLILIGIVLMALVTRKAK
jgi:hypothetical protein